MFVALLSRHIMIKLYLNYQEYSFYQSGTRKMKLNADAVETSLVHSGNYTGDTRAVFRPKQKDSSNVSSKVFRGETMRGCGWHVSMGKAPRIAGNLDTICEQRRRWKHVSIAIWERQGRRLLWRESSGWQNFSSAEINVKEDSGEHWFQSGRRCRGESD